MEISVKLQACPTSTEYDDGTELEECTIIKLDSLWAMGDAGS